MAELTKTHLMDSIQSANKLFMQRFEKAQFTQLAALYTHDGAVLPPNMETLPGREAIAGLWQAVYGMGIQSLSLNTLEVDDCGNMAVEVGQFELYSADRQLLDKGKYLVAWKQEEGEWRLFRDIFNSSLPAQK
jgi:ketosteroid isomerase-like protein